MTSQEIAQAFIRARRKRDDSLLESLFHPDAFLPDEALGTAKGEERIKLRHIGRSFNPEFEIVHTLCTEDRIILCWKERAWVPGRDSIPPGTPPDHESIAISVMHVRDGKISARWVARDLSFYAKTLGW